MKPMSDGRTPGAGLTRTQTSVVAVVVFALAMLMGWPALRGTFVGGDDHRLVLNHVLVNQPSLAHAVELFFIVHRDLYQPIPLLTFQLEFIVAGWLDLFAESIDGGAWLFHFDNTWLHGLNALLVAAVIAMLLRPLGGDAPPTPLRRFHIRRRSAPQAAADTSAAASEAGSGEAAPDFLDGLYARLAIAWTAASIFAVHPLQVEVVSWINGRMMLLSTMFALLAMLCFSHWLARGAKWAALLTIFLVVLSGISKIRAGVPILLALVPLCRGIRLDRRFWPLWTVCTATVAGLVLLNIWTTAEAEFFSGGASHLQGPRAVRVLMALAFYFEHFVWPVGLASYYPAPLTVAWLSAPTIRAALIVGAALTLLAWSSFRYRHCRWAVIWFLAGIADTLPFFPARNILAADRYMYLPIVGLAWIAATLGHAAYRRLAVRHSRSAAQRATAVAAVILIPLLIGICWRVAASYNTAQSQALRIAELFPNEPRAWERLGWTYHRAGDYEKALEAAHRELQNNGATDAQSGALQLLGLTQVKLGEVEAGLSNLEKAIELDVDDGIAYFRLATAHEDLGRYAEAAAWYEKAVEFAPRDNPTLRRLARAYRRLDKLAEARQRYQQALEFNRHDVDAAIGLAELAIESGADEQLRESRDTLGRLLADVPAEPRMTGNLGMIEFLLGGADTNLKRAAAAFIAHTDGRFDQALDRAQALSGLESSVTQARHWLLAQLERYDQQWPENPYTFLLTAAVLRADGQTEAANMALQLAASLCADEPCRAAVDRLDAPIIPP